MDLIISAATHRTGSTLLQRIFNARAKTLIWGEQDGALTHFFKIYKKAEHYSVDLSDQRRKYFENNEDPNRWIACMMPELEYVEEAIINSIKAFCETLYTKYPGNHDIIGFKEVRYGEDELTLFRKCYPKAEIILLVRNPVDVWKSMIGVGLGNNVNRMVQKWNRNTEYYLKLAQNDPKAHLILYEDMINRDKSTLDLISDLGQLTKQEIDHVLNKKILSTSKEIATKQREFIVNKCEKIMKECNYI